MVVNEMTRALYQKLFLRTVPDLIYTKNRLHWIA